MKSKAKNRKLNVVFLGERMRRDRLISVLLHGKQEIGFPKMISRHCIGDTYVLEMEGTDYIFPRRGLVYSKREVKVTDKQVKEWQKESELAHDEAAGIRERKKLKNNSKFLDCLEPIAKDYNAATFNRKVAIEIAVLKYLRFYMKGIRK